MEPSPITPSAILTATIQEIQAYPKYIKRNISLSQSANINANIDNLVKTGKLTQEQANLVIKGTNRNSMFGTLLDMMQDPDSGDSTDSTPTTADPFSILLDAFKANDDSGKNDSPLFDTLAGLIPPYDQLGRQPATSAKNTNIKGTIFPAKS
jgi:hypothetical protein